MLLRTAGWLALYETGYLLATCVGLAATLFQHAIKAVFTSSMQANRHATTLSCIRPPWPGEDPLLHQRPSGLALEGALCEWFCFNIKIAPCCGLFCTAQVYQGVQPAAPTQDLAWAATACGHTQACTKSTTQFLRRHVAMRTKPFPGCLRFKGAGRRSQPVACLHACLPACLHAGLPACWAACQPRQGLPASLRASLPASLLATMATGPRGPAACRHRCSAEIPNYACTCPACRHCVTPGCLEHVVAWRIAQQWSHSPACCGAAVYGGAWIINHSGSAQDRSLVSASTPPGEWLQTMPAQCTASLAFHCFLFKGQVQAVSFLWFSQFGTTHQLHCSAACICGKPCKSNQLLLGCTAAAGTDPVYTVLHLFGKQPA